MTAPCCGCSLQLGCKIIAILEIIGSLIGIIMLIFIMVIYSYDDEGIDAIQSSVAGNTAPTQHDLQLHEESWTGWVMLSIFLVTGLVWLVLGFVLFIGASKRDVKKVRIWCCVSLILVFIEAINSVIEICGWGAGHDKSYGIPIILISIYFLGVGYSFVGELREEEKHRSFRELDSLINP